MTARPFPRTSAPRSAIVHGLAIDRQEHVTLCGRRIGDDWAGEYTEMPQGPIDCKRCLIHLDPSVTGPVPAVTRQYVNDGDTYRFSVMGEFLGHVSPVGDGTGDRVARRASGEIVAPRFTSTDGAESYLSGGDRPALCADGGAHGHGGCIRQDGHPAEHKSSDRFTWTDADTQRIVADRVARRAAAEGTGTFHGTDMDGKPVALTVLSTDAYNSRARSMAAHPAGKGRPRDVRGLPLPMVPLTARTTFRR